MEPLSRPLFDNGHAFIRGGRRRANGYEANEALSSQVPAGQPKTEKAICSGPGLFVLRPSSEGPV
ncbi:hypothetical protein VD0004_g9233 [Verticillium dahliae]|uniref:Uncharacterized protein n=1 Tax=Verticillium dahliae TaxID=27337 RepID=A0A2J8DTG6_VERDA|nr:hypothetical protein BJF96_g7161 [Verticillium dahliae]PNH37553.1 hypothetical protein VD0004_g9233 [Verticillium dahliae]PNH52575.1 hypothetical protein VD0003_g4741 [Verticillium dahliae]PNH67786.1 hypothetical protein VD0001_g7694 [Verticillium dahliae]RBQ68330.1 hypothetical protein VDGD_21595 [Verticillium dahliae]